ncbi:bifunctional proline dehydrogenase/L-glutamate gamma-semialdehyde dehydrogenase [Microbacterium gilvum]|uniref:L-glutamate gamma-semialdehyde dehydrogenase n=1 Tax=Microbacterium gilvum TaxID=1336204 RepID=A0ABP9AP42_9MICO
MVDGAAHEDGGAIVEEAVALARRWVDEAATADVDASAERLAGVLEDPRGLPFTIGFVDGVMRPESLPAAAAELARIAPLAPSFLPWHLRSAIRAGGVVGPVAPFAVVPAARRALRRMVGHLIVDARPDKLGPALAALREKGARLNLNLLGEAVLGEKEAHRRLEGIHELVRRPDVDYVSVKVSAIASRLSMWAFEETVAAVADRLLPLYLSAAGNGTFLNLDMEEYRDLDLTVAVFRRLLDDPRLHGYHAGIVLQAYLPDALPALDALTAWAQERVDGDGAPIKVRLVKGANLAMERVDAALHGWPQAPYDTKADTDANYLRCLDAAFDTQRTRAVRIGVAGHNLFDIAWAWLRAGERGVRDAVEFEMLLGMAEGQMQAVARDVGRLLLYVPVVKPDEFDAAVSYLVRRLEETASAENFLSSAFRLHDDDRLFAREADRFRASASRAGDASLAVGPRRRPQRDGEPERPLEAPAEPDAAALADTRRIGRDDGAWHSTAVFASHEGAPAVGAAGFRNAPDTDPSLAANREWGRAVLSRVPRSRLGVSEVEDARIADAAGLDAVVARVREAASAWGGTPAAERAELLRAVARELERRRGDLVEVAAAETGKVLAEADTEVSEAVDFAAYYAANAGELDRVPGAVFQPSRVTVVAPPWNFPLAIPAGGVLAALAAGSGVVFKPAHQARRSAAVLAEAMWAAGVPRDLLALVALDAVDGGGGDADGGGLGRRLVSHADVDRVILTGSWETARLFRTWRPDLALHAETSGKNAVIVTPSADLDLAAADIVRSAFGHAGQKCSAASLAILVGPIGRSRRFARQLVDATRSLRVGPAHDPLSEVGPLIEAPRGKLAWALSELEEGESWLLRPRPLDDGDDRLWSPGIRIGVRAGSRFHREEFFGPVLGVMHAATLDDAIALQNAVDYGLTAGLHTQDPDDLERWLETVQAGNLYVNRGITGAVVQRQPFGGWKRSSVGTGAKAGGPNHLVGLGSWRATGGAQALGHPRGLDGRIAAFLDAARPGLPSDEFEWLRRAAHSDASAWEREFGQVKDVSGLGVERNLFRYRATSAAVRATADAAWKDVLRVVVAGIRAADWFSLSVPGGLPAPVRRALGDLDVPVAVESDDDWVERMAGGIPEPAADTTSLATSEQILGIERERPNRVRIVADAGESVALHRRLAHAVGGDPDLAIWSGDVTTAGRLELLPFLREQAISITAHRFGNPDDRFSEVI